MACTLTRFHTYSTTWNAQYGIQMAISSTQLDRVICCRVTAHPLASNSNISINVVYQMSANKSIRQEYSNFWHVQCAHQDNIKRPNSLDSECPVYHRWF